MFDFIKNTEGYGCLKYFNPFSHCFSTPFMRSIKQCVKVKVLLKRFTVIQTSFLHQILRQRLNPSK
jgi:hypothetical protein